MKRITSTATAIAELPLLVLGDMMHYFISCPLYDLAMLVIGNADSEKAKQAKEEGRKTKEMFNQLRDEGWAEWRSKFK